MHESSGHPHIDQYRSKLYRVEEHNTKNNLENVLDNVSRCIPKWQFSKH